MAEATNKHDKRLRGSGAAKHRAQKNRREAASRLQRLVKAVGNNEIGRRLSQGNATRDMMMAHLVERLHLIREVQVREVQATRRGANWEWWRQVADSHATDWSKPEPTRWHTTAQYYDHAARVLCSGDLKQGQIWIERAMAEEDRHWNALSDNVVDTNSLEFQAQSKWESLWVDSLVAETPATGACELPPDIALADEIRSVEQTMDDPMNRRRRRDPWWTLEEEKEEEEHGDGGGG